MVEKTVIHLEMDEDGAMLIEQYKGNCMNLMTLLAIIAAEIESQLPSELRGKFRIDLLKAMNVARNELIDGK